MEVGSSKTSLLRALLINAWVNNWDDIQWGTEIKAVLPRGVSGDVYNLTEIILQEATVGHKPNLEALSYLRHSLRSHLISFPAVLYEIGNVRTVQENWEAVKWLIKFINSILDSVVCRNRREELYLPRGVLAITNWLCYVYSLRLGIGYIDGTRRRIKKEKPEKEEEKKTNNKKVDEKKTDNKKVDEKKTDNKKVDEKKTDNKKVDEKKTDNKEVDEKKTGNKKVDEKKTNNKKVDEKKTDNKKVDEKKTDNKKVEEKEADVEEVEEKDDDILVETRLALKKIAESDFLRSMIYIGKWERFGSLYERVTVRCQDVTTLLVYDLELPQAAKDVLESIFKLYNTEFLMNMEVPERRGKSDHYIQSFLITVIFQNPTLTTEELMKHLLIAQHVKDYTNCELYTELMKACFINLNDATKKLEESQWGAFIFIKLPIIIRELAFYFYVYPPRDQLLPEIARKEIVKAFVDLIHFSTLIHSVDVRTSCSSIEILIKELQSFNLLTDEDKIDILNSMEEEWKKSGFDKVKSFKDVSPPSNKPAPIIIITSTARQTLATVLKTMETEYSKIQAREAWLGVLNQFICGHSFDVIMSVATVTGKLSVFVGALIRFNEYSKHVSIDDPKSVQIKSSLFDTSFLVLCNIVQHYGPKVIFPGKIVGDSFFEKWVRYCFTDRDHNKVKMALKRGNEIEKLTIIMAWFDSPECDTSRVPMDWDDICLAMPGIMNRILKDWIQNKCTASDVKEKIDKIRSLMCSLAICSVNWLAARMQEIAEVALLKPRNMLQKFLSPLPDESTQTESKFPIFHREDFRDSRSFVAYQVMIRMVYDVNSPVMPVHVRLCTRNLISKEPIMKHFKEAWNHLYEKSWLEFKQVQEFEIIFRVMHVKMFVGALVKELLTSSSEIDLYKVVEFILGLFHLNLQECVLALIKHVPQLLFKPIHCTLINGPQSDALANLVARSIYAAFQCYEPFVMFGRRTPGSLPSPVIEDDSPPMKVIKTEEKEDVHSGREVKSQQHKIIDEQLQTEIINMFTIFNHVADRSFPKEPNSDVDFVFKVMEELVLCGKKASKYIFQCIPDSLVTNLCRSLPRKMSVKLMAHLHDLQTPLGCMRAIRDMCLLQRIIEEDEQWISHKDKEENGTEQKEKEKEGENDKDKDKDEDEDKDKDKDKDGEKDNKMEVDEENKEKDKEKEQEKQKEKEKEKDKEKENDKETEMDTSEYITPDINGLL